MLLYLAVLRSSLITNQYSWHLTRVLMRPERGIIKILAHLHYSFFFFFPKPYLLQQNCCSSKNSALKHRRKTGNNFPLVQSKTIILHNNKNNIIIIICIYHAHVNIYILINICVWVYLCEIHKHSIYNLNICN